MESNNSRRKQERRYTSMSIKVQLIINDKREERAYIGMVIETVK